MARPAIRRTVRTVFAPGHIAGVIGQVSFSRDGSVAAFTKSDSQHPDDVYTVKTLPIGEPLKLTDHNPQVRDLALGSSEVIRWKSKDGREIEGILIYPIGYEAGKRYPLITSIHGGPEGAYQLSFMASYAELPHFYAARGYASFFPNFRGSSNYGPEFASANVNDLGGGD